MAIDGTSSPVRDITFDEAVDGALRFDQFITAVPAVFGFVLVRASSGNDGWLAGLLIAIPAFVSLPVALNALAILVSGRTPGMRRYGLAAVMPDGLPAPRARVLLRSGPALLMAILALPAALPALVGDSKQSDVVSLALMVASFAATGLATRRVRRGHALRDQAWRDELSGTRLVALMD